MRDVNIIRFCGATVTREKLTRLAELSRNMLCFIRDHSGRYEVELTFGAPHSDQSAIIAFKRNRTNAVSTHTISTTAAQIKRRLGVVGGTHLEVPNMERAAYLSRSRARKFIIGGAPSPFKRKPGRPARVICQHGPIMPVPLSS